MEGETSSPPDSAQAAGDRARHYCWAPAAAGTGIPRVVVAEMTGEPARGPRGEGVGTEEIPDIMLALLTGVLPPAMLDEPIRA